MRFSLLQVAVGAALLMNLSGVAARAADWQPVPGHLMTRWAKDVNPNNPLPDYPRPQMVRRDWKSLNGLWDYAIQQGSRVEDAGPGHRHGGILGAPVWDASDGPTHAGAYRSDGQANGVEIPRVVQDNFTIAFWVKTTQHSGKPGAWYTGIGLVDGECPGVVNDFGVSLTGNIAAFGVGNPDTTILASTIINDGQWHHIAAARTKSTGAMRLYVDGRLEVVGVGGRNSLTSPHRLTIGQIQTNINPFQGSIADVRLYDRPLSDAEVAGLHSGGQAANPGAGLAGWWKLAADWKITAGAPEYQGKILVPYPLESSLSGVQKPLTAGQRLWYRRRFTAPELHAGSRLLLHFGAVDWEAKVWVNGIPVGEHRGGYDAFTCDITAAARPGKENEVTVQVYDATGGFQPRGKQSPGAMFSPGGIFYTPCSGIWQTVWLETVPAASIADLKIVPDIDSGVVRVTVTPRGAADALTVTAEATDGRRIVGRASGRPGETLAIPIPAAHLWTPDDPFLYDLKLKLGQDEVSSYFGMRKIALGKDERGITRPLLNGKFVFQAGPLDQGFWPDGIYTAPTDAALKWDIEEMKRMGFNMARKHVKVEPQRWYYWCDRLGLLVWQDMPAGDVGTGGTDKPISPESAAIYERELRALIAQHANHPCIVMWVVFNEGWGQFDTPRITQLARDLDPTRLVNNASGWNDHKVGDVIDMHNYPGPGSPRPEAGRAAVLGEFGGLGLPIRDHLWTDSSWGYQGMKDAEHLTERYLQLWERVWQLKDDPGLSAAVYTQLTDCETECNGLLTYDRKVEKIDPAKLAAAHRHSVRAGAQHASR